MKCIELGKTTYGFVRDFKHDQKLRASFNELTEATFGINFENWYAAGLWGDNYIPYSLMHQDKVVANVSISKIEFLIDNEKKLGVQIGTVMTNPEYQGRGLSRFLMEQILNEWKDQSDFIYLFANNSVLNFYPKFNFERVEQYQHSKALNSSGPPSATLRKLNTDNDQDKELLIQTIKASAPMAKLSMRNNTSLIMFYCLSFKKNSIYYHEKLKAVVIADIEGSTLYLNDVFSEAAVELNELIESMSDTTIQSVVLGFTPLDESGYQITLMQPEDTLFVIQEQAHYFKDKPWMFPVLSHA